MIEPDLITWESNESGYEGETSWRVSKKHGGTDPDVVILQQGRRAGSLTLSVESARRLAKTLLFLVGAEK